MRLFVITEKPSDFPDFFVVRIHYPVGFQFRPHCLATSLEDARDSIPAHCSQIDRELADDPVIVESWLDLKTFTEEDTCQN